MPCFRRAASRLLSVAVVLATLAGCLPRPSVGSLRPTLSLVDVPGGRAPIQDGIVVPSFGVQPRPRLELDGPWRVETTALDTALSLTDRSSALPRILAEAGGRERPDYDDSRWPTVDVPGSTNPPPAGHETGAWYRRSFVAPLTWEGRSVTLKLAAVNYVADVWLNGRYLGTHEGGYTPFAFDATPALRFGGVNVLAVRVDNPTLGTRADTVPWGLVDWWNYGGITQSVWLEASAPVRAARADVVPHLDGADVTVVVENRGASGVEAAVRVDVLPAALTAANLLDPDPASLIASGPAPPANPRLPRSELPPAGGVGQGRVVASATATTPSIAPGGSAAVTTSLLIPNAAAWDLDRPNLYVARVTVDAPGGVHDTLLESFGLRRIAVEDGAPRLLLNGNPVALDGVALHDEVIQQAVAGQRRSAGRPHASAAVLAQLRRAMSVDATFVRTAHTPANPDLLTLADRLGLAVWEEIPVYHFTPLTFGIATDRGVARQMLREMALRDMNHPAVLFHGLSNESTGGSERHDALIRLRDVDREIDGTRLVGQAAYGFDAADGTSDGLDVAGITSYFGVFYGRDPRTDTAAALDAAHARYPTMPVMVLEFGYWADTPADQATQRTIFTETAAAIAPRRDTQRAGFVGSEVWWTLEDYLTLRPGLTVEQFGLFAPGGAPRPVVADVRARYASEETVAPVSRESRGEAVPESPPSPSWVPAAIGVLALVVGLGGPLSVLGFLVLRDRRTWTPVRRTTSRRRWRRPTGETR